MTKILKVDYHNEFGHALSDIIIEERPANIVDHTLVGVTDVTALFLQHEGFKAALELCAVSDLIRFQSPDNVEYLDEMDKEICKTEDELCRQTISAAKVLFPEVDFFPFIQYEWIGRERAWEIVDVQQKADEVTKHLDNFFATYRSLLKPD